MRNKSNSVKLNTCNLNLILETTIKKIMKTLVGEDLCGMADYCRAWGQEQQRPDLEGFKTK